MGRKATFYLLGNLLVVFSAAALVAAIVCRQAPEAPLTTGWLIAGLLSPVLFGLNLLLLIWWLAWRRWFVALIPLAALVVGAGDMLLLVQPPRTGEQTAGDLRVATLNVHGFQIDPSRDLSAHRVAKMLREEQVDVACLQEALDDAKHPFDSLALHFTGRMPYYVRELSMAFFSRYPILDHQYVRFPESNQSYMRVDVQMGDRKVRFISVHLQTSGFSSLYRHSRRGGMGFPVEAFCTSLTKNAAIRAVQVAEIRRLIDTSSMPVIVAGDFNDTPMSKTYRVMRDGFSDAFLTAGRGWGGSYKGLLRIDYVLYDDHFKAADYYVWRKEELSDHNPVIADLQFVHGS